MVAVYPWAARTETAGFLHAHHFQIMDAAIGEVLVNSQKMASGSVSVRERESKPQEKSNPQGLVARRFHMVRRREGS